MDYLSYKFKLIYSRYLIIALGSIIGFSLLNTCFFQTQLIPIEDFFYEFLIPMLLPILPLIFWLRPRLKLLRLERKNGKNLFEFYLIIAWFALICPSIFAQKYITSAVGQLTKLKTINSIDQRHLTKFYKVRNLYLDKTHCAVQVEAKATGKHNENLNYTVYAAIPIYNESTPPLWGSSATVRPSKYEVKSSNRPHIDCLQPKAWLGWQMTKQISNRLTQKTKDAIYRKFLKDSYLSFVREKIYGFDYLQKIGNSQDYKNFKKGIAHADPDLPANPILLIPKYTPFEKRGSKQLLQTLLSFS
jgi:rhomboid protease GluP